MENYDNEYYNREDLKSLLFESIASFWNCRSVMDLRKSLAYISDFYWRVMRMLTAHPCEIVGAVDGSINAVALHDFEVMKELFDYDFAAMEQTLEAGCFAILRDYRHTNGNSKVFNTRIRNRICDLSRGIGGDRVSGSISGDDDTVLPGIRRRKAGASQGVPRGTSGRRTGRNRANHEHCALHLDDLVGYEIRETKAD